jgi:hypothetical protein
MSLYTYCHAPLTPGTQAEIDLSPLFKGAPSMADRRVTRSHAALDAAARHCRA